MAEVFSQRCQAEWLALFALGQPVLDGAGELDHSMHLPSALIGIAGNVAPAMVADRVLVNPKQAGGGAIGFAAPRGFS